MSYSAIEAIRARRSIRKYVSGMSVADEDIRLMLESAMMAPSSCNTRAWEFFVIKDQAVKDMIASGYSPYAHAAASSVMIVVCGMPEKQKGASTGFWPQDCAAATQNILLSATQLGYGTCWCGAYPFSERVETLQRILKTTSIPFNVIALGISDEAPAPRGFYEEEKVHFI